MREVAIQDVGAALERCIERASFTMDPALREALSRGEKAERNCTGCAILDQLLRNADIAQAERRPLCQDTGVAVVYLDIGQEVRLTGGGVEEGVNAAVREAYRKFALRPSITRHPLRRVNTGDNTPAVIHMRITPGDRVRVEFLAKGGGCENMSRLAMLKPSDGREGVMEFVLRAVRESGGNACPPLVVGVGIGGNFERVAELAKSALRRPFGEPASDPDDRDLERELWERINALDLGPMGFGGDTTALAVHVASQGCHIASLPVAVNLDCHSHRYAMEVV